MKKIKITIDGQKLEVTEGVTLLEAAKSEGIEKEIEEQFSKLRRD